MTEKTIPVNDSRRRENSTSESDWRRLLCDITKGSMTNTRDKCLGKNHVKDIGVACGGEGSRRQEKNKVGLVRVWEGM